MKTMNEKELQKIIKSHKLWLNDEGGAKANLSNLDLSYVNLSGANLIGVNLSGADLYCADLSHADLSHANLHGADLRGADLRGADLCGANIDFSCFPLWCGSMKIKTDMKLVYQLLAHVYALDCNDKEFKEVQKAIKKYALKSHRAKDLEIL